MMPFSFTCIDSVNKSIEDAEKGISKLPEGVLQLQGMSSPKVRHFLNNLCGYFPDETYMEVGCYKGSTFVSAGYQNKMRMIGVDNWSEFDGSQHEFELIKNRWLEDNHVTFYDQNAFTIDVKRILDKVGIYFYDGAHDPQSHINAFTHFNPVFENIFIAIVDDWNMDGAKIGTKEAFRVLKYDILGQWELPAKFNGDTENWWDGLFVAVVRK